MIMRKVFLIMAMALPMVLMSCSDDDGEKMKTIKNLTGTSWYDAQI